MTTSHASTQPTRSHARRSSHAALPILALLSIAAPLSAQTTPAPAESADGNDVVRLVPFTVTGQASEDANFAMGMRNAMPTLETPRSVQIFNRRLIDEIQPQFIENIVTLASNVSFLGDSDGRGNTFVIRGFQEAPILLDGIRVENFGGISDPELYNLEQVEVLKGPDSILYGESNPGGLINLVSKRPRSKAHGEIALEVGSTDSVSPRFDIGGPLGENSPLRYRLVGLYKHDEGWRDYNNPSERVFIAPTLAWDISQDTSVIFITEFTEDTKPADFGTAIDANGDLVAPPERVNNHPDDTIDRHQYTLGYDLEHYLSSDWKIQNRFRYIDSGYEYSPLLLPIAYDPVTSIYTRAPAIQTQSNEEWTAQLNLTGNLYTGDLRHRIFSGVDFRQSKVNGTTRFDPGSLVPLDFSNPDYSIPPPPAALIPLFFDTTDDITRYGVFFQDHIDIGDRWILSAGFRYDETRRETRGAPAATRRDDAFVPQAGLVYKLTKTSSAYASYTESFLPGSANDIAGNPLPPEEGKGIEVGYKTELFERRLLLNLAVFQITKVNVATADPTDPAFPFGASVASGEQRARGFELDATGRLTDRWSLLATYGYTEAEVTDDNTIPEGNRLVGAPRHTASLWSYYTFDSGALKGFGFGAGLTYVGNRAVDQANTVFIDGYVLLNAALSYRTGDWRWALNLNNLTDKEYVESAWGGTSRSVHAGQPFNAVASATYSF